MKLVISNELCFYRSADLAFPVATYPYFPMISIRILENGLTEKDIVKLYRAYNGYNKEPLKKRQYKGYTIYIYKDEEAKRIYFMAPADYLTCIGL